MNNKRSIPEIRDRLRELADELGVDELNTLADEMHRNSPIQRAPSTSTPLSPELAEEIRQYVAKNPGLPQQKYANEFNINPGRISESLRYFK